MTLRPTASALEQLLGQQQADFTNSSLLAMPPSLRSAALVGDLVLDNNVTLLPSSRAQLSILAGHDFVANPTGTFLLMSDAPAGTYPTPANPRVTLNEVGFLANGAIHSGDAQPVIIPAGNDINGVRLQLPKVAQISAGRDIVNLSFVGQNLSRGDTTVISAGRDIIQQPSQTDIAISVGGPGALDLLAG